MVQEDYYSLLGVSRDSSSNDIKKAYRKLALKYHPDRNPDNKEAEDKFKKISEAYDTLIDDKKRQRYDSVGHQAYTSSGGSSSSGANPFDIFKDFFGQSSDGDDIFGSIFGSGSRRGQKKGSSLQYELDISFEEAAFGVTKSIKIPISVKCKSCGGLGSASSEGIKNCAYCNGMGKVRLSQGFFQVEKTCSSCGGEGKRITDPCSSCHARGVIKENQSIDIKIPKGIDSGMKLRLAGKGNAGEGNAPSGDLYILVNVRDHDIFSRDGQNIYCDIPINFATACLGGEVEVPTLYGMVRLRIPAGTQTHSLFRFKNKGISSPHGGLSKGDQIVKVIIETPNNVTKNQKDLLAKFVEEGKDKYYPLNNSFLTKVKRFLKID